jgi:hypothetical protein
MTTKREDDEPGPNAAVEGAGHEPVGLLPLGKGDAVKPLAADQQEAVRNAGAGGLSDYAKQAYAAGEDFGITAEDAASMGAGFVQDTLKAAIAATEPPPEPLGELTLTSLSPDTAELGGEDVTVSFIGTGFDATCEIVFAGHSEETVLVSDTELTTIVKPSLGWGPVAVAAYVRNVITQSETLMFTFTAGEPVTLTSLTPNTAVVGDADLVISLAGTGFTDATTVNFGGVEQQATLASDTEIFTNVSPAAAVAGDVPVFVTEAGQVSETLQFTFTEPSARSTKRGK